MPDKEHRLHDGRHGAALAVRVSAPRQPKRDRGSDGGWHPQDPPDRGAGGRRSQQAARSCTGRGAEDPVVAGSRSSRAPPDVTRSFRSSAWMRRRLQRRIAALAASERQPHAVYSAVKNPARTASDRRRRSRRCCGCSRGFLAPERSPRRRPGRPRRVVATRPHWTVRHCRRPAPHTGRRPTTFDSRPGSTRQRRC